MYILKVDGMTDRGCTSEIEREITLVDQEADVSIDILKKEVKVQSVKPVAEVVTVLEKNGFNVLEVRPSS